MKTIKCIEVEFNEKQIVDILRKEAERIAKENQVVTDTAAANYNVNIIADPNYEGPGNLYILNSITLKITQEISDDK